MLSNLAYPSEWTVLQQYFEDLDIRNEIKSHALKVTQLSEDSQKLVKEVLAELGHENIPLSAIDFSFNLIYFYEHNKYLIYEPDYFFNRYRMLTLRSQLYEDFQPFDIQKARNFCRTKESEALKSGLKPAVWRNRSGEALFGPSEIAADFSGKSSSGWKFIALSNFVIDLFANENKMDLIRISPYDTIMVESKILQIASLIKLKDSAFKPAIQKYVARKLSIDLPQS